MHRMAGSTPAAGPPLSAGDLLLDRYRIVELMTQGGHSLVYRVDDERLRRPACAKVMNVDGLDDRLRKVIEQHFVQEVFVLSRLSHAHTVQIYDFGYLDRPSLHGADTPFQICELLDGGPLSRFVKKRERLSVAETLSMTSQLCGALAEVHHAGLIHGDVKPQNVLLSETLTARIAKLGDFGVAQPAHAGSEESNSVLMYSVNWAAPEQLVGEPLGPAADLYSLALVTIFMLTGRLVFQETDPVDAYRRRKYAREVVANCLEEISLPGEAISFLLAACNFDPRERIQDALMFGRLLEQTLAPALLLEGTPVTSSTGRSGERAPMTAEPPSVSGATGRVVAADLWSLSTSRPCPEIAGRKPEFVPADPWCDLVIAENVRVRVSFVPSSTDGSGLHIRGLNCFVAVAEGRPSSAITVDATDCVDFISTLGEPVARATVTLATEGIERTAITLAGHSVVVPRSECASLAAIDFGVGSSCYLPYIASTVAS